MSYKNMIASVAGREASKWIKSFIKPENGFATDEKTELRTEGKFCFFETKVGVYGIKSFMNKYTVSGTIDTYGRVYLSVIKDWSDKYVWVSNEETRQALGIEKQFEIN